MTELSTTHWNCECETRYIHPNFHKFCPTCGAERDEQPDSHLEEVADIDKHWKPREEPPYETTESMMDRLAEHVRILREALGGILPWVQHEDPGTGEAGDAFRADLARAQAALEATSGEEEDPEICECGRPWSDCATRDGADQHRDRS